jgi:hypothetical protein
MSLSPEQHQEIAEFVEAENEKLRAAGAESAEQAFGMGCGLGLLPTIIIIIVLFVLKVINFILAIVLLGMGILAVVGISMLLASRARVNSERTTYQTSVEPEIIQYFDERDLPAQQFGAIVREQLPENAPLRIHLDQAGIINFTQE